MKLYIKFLALIFSILMVGLSYAESFPDRPIKLIVGYAPGGGTDLVARVLAPYLSKALGQPIVVDNKPGAGGSAAASYVAKSKPDGYTLLISSASSVSIYPALNPKVDYQLKDFEPVSQLTIAPLVLVVNKNLGIHSVAELIKAAKSSPGKLNYASSGIGSGPHFAGVLFEEIAGVQMTHIPFKSGSPAVISVVGGESQLTFATTPTVMQLIRSGQLVGLAVTSKEASSLVPNLPGMKDAGLANYQMFQWNGIFAPTGTPKDIVNKIYTSLKLAMKNPAVKKSLESEGTEVLISGSPESFSTFLKEDAKFWNRLISVGGVKAFE
ncbi:tripartite tricarboxylate transporter substrate binding protein [Polynucleobacter sp. AP-Melu-500A-A1]|uniref:Bug family tripartite tricarboxylate transporter substrate binding protein n=1 Tax=Polynucleobacter sp. AP-Melu-500A-A1 TaxID=2576929 RepID=UPI001C0E1673|nr:tripartite tricarboxylate transporter substrate binding protein [Polynucleobacter sp. AP-Melu-500A-A1]MBU3631515.1 tripartite tricarboxylate transporter substrate binding protein [Polynucleobacter sp. AP-Melu-500A-A1]